MKPKILRDTRTDAIFIVVGYYSYWLFDSYQDHPSSCEFKKVTTSVIKSENVETISVSKVKTFILQGFMLFLFEKNPNYSRRSEISQWPFR